MKKEFIINSKYNELIEEFLELKKKYPKQTSLKKFCAEKELNYHAFRKATLRKAIELKKGDTDSYTVIQIPIGIELYDKLVLLAKEKDTTIPKLARETLKNLLYAL